MTRPLGLTVISTLPSPTRSGAPAPHSRQEDTRGGPGGWRRRSAVTHPTSQPHGGSLQLGAARPLCAAGAEGRRRLPSVPRPSASRPHGGAPFGAPSLVPQLPALTAGLPSAPRVSSLSFPPSRRSSSGRPEPRPSASRPHGGAPFRAPTLVPQLPAPRGPTPPRQRGGLPSLGVGGSAAAAGGTGARLGGSGSLGVRQRAPRIPPERGREEPPARRGRGREKRGRELPRPLRRAARDGSPRLSPTCGEAGKLPAATSDSATLPPLPVLSRPSVSCTANHLKEREFFNPFVSKDLGLFSAAQLLSLPCFGEQKIRRGG